MEKGGAVSPKSEFDPKMVDDELRVTLPKVFVAELVANGSNVTPFTVAPALPAAPKLYAETNAPSWLTSLSPVIVFGLLHVTNPACAGTAAVRQRARMCGICDLPIRTNDGEMRSGVIMGECGVRNVERGQDRLIHESRMCKTFCRRIV